MYLIVGLGNPGLEFENTRHNAGFLALDEIALMLKQTFKLESKFFGMTAKGIYKGNKYILLKPITYVNLSGRAIIRVIQYYKIPIENIIIIYDDINIEFNYLRLREKGGDGGHNGMKNIVNTLKSTDFKRARIGVGNNKQIAQDKFVLSKFSNHELHELQSLFNDIANLSLKIIEGISFIDIMTEYNTKYK